MPDVMRDEIAARLLRFFGEAFPERASELNLETDLIAEVFVDSFGIVDTLVFIEEQYQVELLADGPSAESFHSVRALVDLVARAIEAKAAS